MVQTVYTCHLEKKGKEDIAYNLEIAGRWLFPIIFISFTSFSILKGIYS
jgi:hypothetical protein